MFFDNPGFFSDVCILRIVMSQEVACFLGWFETHFLEDRLCCRVDDGLPYPSSFLQSLASTQLKT